MEGEHQIEQRVLADYIKVELRKEEIMLYERSVTSNDVQ